MSCINKLFTKYTAIEGEIKDGDMYLLKSIGTPNLRKKGLYPKWNVYQFDSSKTNCKLAKLTPKTHHTKAMLSICSKDIEVGDMISLDGVEFIKYEAGPVDSLWRKHVREGFKVIGYVLPDATWVKEGMEFEKEDLLAQGIGLFF